MPVTVVPIGVMRVRVHQGRVLVLMRVRFDTIPAVEVRGQIGSVRFRFVPRW